MYFFICYLLYKISSNPDLNIIHIGELQVSWSRGILQSLTVPHLVNNVPYILWNPKFHYHIHNNAPLVRMQSQINPVHAHPSYFPKKHFNINTSSTSRPSPQSSTFKFPAKSVDKEREKTRGKLRIIMRRRGYQKNKS
jgi:hypothetical protein